MHHWQTLIPAPAFSAEGKWEEDLENLLFHHARASPDKDGADARWTSFKATCPNILTSGWHCEKIDLIQKEKRNYRYSVCVQYMCVFFTHS